MAMASAALFGASTPLAKLLLGGGADPWLLAGLLYLGSGLGLGAAGLMRRFADVPRGEAPLRKADLPWLGLVVLTGGMIGEAPTTSSSTARGGGCTSSAAAARWTCLKTRARAMHASPASPAAGAPAPASSFQDSTVCSWRRGLALSAAAPLSWFSALRLERLAPPC
jgi:hypothetical protein